MKILVFGHWSHTGFGIVTEELCLRFLAEGHDPRIIAVNHRGEPVVGPLQGRVWPAQLMGQAYGGNIGAAAIDGSLWGRFGHADWKPDVVLVISDMSGLFGHVGRGGLTGPWMTTPVYHYCPIEGDNLTPAWKDVWGIVRPVAMSDYGASIIGSLIGHAVPRIYHGVNTDVYRPLTQTDPLQWEGKFIHNQREAKIAIGVNPDRKLIIRSDRLVERKFYDRFMTMASLVFERVDDVDILLHCSPVDAGLNLGDEIARLPEQHRKRIFLTNAHDTFRGLPIEGMVILNNAGDLYVTTTGGEGFGLNLAESIACGTPVVSTDWAACREVVGDGGIVVPPLIDPYGEAVRYHSSYGMDWAVPDPRAFVEPVVSILTRPARRRAMGDAGRVHVKRSFSWDVATAAFLTLFEEADGTARLAV